MPAPTSSRDISLPLRLQVDAGDMPQELLVRQVFRLLPGKRLVGLADCDGRQLVVKLFLEAGRWKQHLQRELQGIDAMQRAQIATAAVIGSGSFTAKLRGPATAASAGGILLLEYLPGISAGDAWRSTASSAAQQALVCRLIGLIARCHQHGLIQKDIHLDNFLLDEETYLLDAADIRVAAAGALAERELLENLALFLAQFPVHNDSHLDSYCDHYQRCRREPGRDAPAVSAQALAAMVQQARLRRWQLVERKLFRETTANICRRQWDRFVVHERSLASAELEAFIDNPDAFIARGQLIKAGNSATVAAVTINGSGYIVKRYNIKNPVHGLRRLLRPSRAWISWRNAHMLQMLGLDTARPWLMMERRIGPLRRQAYFLAESVPGTDALHVLESEPADSAVWQQALQQFRNLLQVMRQYQIVHGDMKATNFICTPERLVVLDLDAMRREPDKTRFRQGWQRDLQRFAQNWQQPDAQAEVRKLLAGVAVGSTNIPRPDAAEQE